MLSFQKEDNNAIINPSQTTDTGASQDGLTQQTDYLTVSGHGKKLRQSTMALVLMFAIGAGGVWFMIKKTSPATANAAPAQDSSQLEAALAQINTVQAEIDSEMNSVVNRFDQIHNVEQISVDELKKNPFELETGAVPDENVAEALEKNKQKDLEAKARQKAGQLELWSITSTPKGNCCMINNKLLYVDDVISDLTIKAINKKSVMLDYNGISIELKMSE